MAGSRPKLLALIPPLLMLGFGVRPAAASEYPRINGQHHTGRRCTLEDPQVAGGTIVMVAGEEAAAGGGTGAACDTFVAYEFHPGQPQVDGPYVEPGLYLHRGGS